MKQIESVGIQGVGYYVPDQVITNEDVERLTSVPAEKVKLILSVDERRWVNDDEALSDIAVKAGEAALKDAGVSPEEIGLLILGTGSSDFYCPPSGCQVQHRLGLKNAMLLNINQACATPIFCLSTAARFVADGTYKKALVICGDISSRFLNFSENLLAGALGDAASAVVLGKLKDGYKGFLSEHFDADGEHFDASGLFAFGSRIPREEFGEGKPYPIVKNEKMNFLIPEIINWFRGSFDICLERAGLTKDDLDFVAPHPAAIPQIYMQLDSAGISYDKNLIVTDKIGHSGGGSMFIILHEAREVGMIKPGSKIFCFGNGAGFNWGGILFRWCDSSEFAN
ncbi:3-oxoacyl-[acyl-carrier-protein] synthase-3 [Anaerovirgula multivorans]|uniref:3-oxoacyl-[acyl-carrier-protein] synthase-3 n=2 Tax=Anaerovirgula multivorans TaxID=312168 RepID=A0A239J613_9FIRM|nr:3-oxoacyl-[acyl-carrier-protein] synthase-3 [Anaerovirgula multivorans]